MFSPLRLWVQTQTTRLARQFKGLMVPFIVGCALFMQMLDATVVAIALPAMAQSFNVPVVELNLTITAYLLAVAMFVPISGWAADQFGARRVFVTAVVIFTISSAGCAISGSVNELITWRALQGVGGAMMVPVGRLILLRSVPRHELLRAMAFLSMPALMGPIFGPPVGGFLVTYASWHWIFLMNLPIGIIGIVISLRHISTDANVLSRRPLDFTGFVLSAVFMASLVSTFEMLARGSIGMEWIAATLALGAACGWLYTKHCKRVATPIVDLTLLKIPTFRESVMGGNLCRFSIGSTPFLLAILLQVGFGMSAVSAGLITFASAAGALLMKLAARPVLETWGYRRVLSVNAVLMGVSMAVCTLFTATTPVWIMISVLLVAGFFRSLQFTAVNTLAFADIPPEKMSAASSFSATAQQLGISLGVAIAASVINMSMNLRGGDVLTRVDMIAGFITIGLLCCLSVFSFQRLPPSAGDSLKSRSRS